MTITPTTNYGLPKPAAGDKDPGFTSDFATAMDTADDNIKTHTPWITVGDPGYATLAAAITAIGATTTTLVFPTGAHVPPATIPSNIILIFQPGAYLDTTGFCAGDIQGLTAYSTTDITVTMTGHGMATGDRVCLYGITQADWLNLNNKPYVITKADNDTFRLNSGINASGYSAYNAGVDAGKITQYTLIAGSIVDTMTKIFNVDSPSIVIGSGFGVRRYGPSNAFVRPEWWGAVGDFDESTGTDNIVPFKYAQAALFLVGNYPGHGIMQLDGDYYLSDTWAMNRSTANPIMRGPNIDGSLTIQGRGLIASGIVGYPIIEIMGCARVNIKNKFRIRALGSGANCPSVAVWVSRSDETANGSDHDIDIKLWGNLQYGVFYNFNAETNKFNVDAPDLALTQQYSFIYAGVCIGSYYKTGGSLGTTLDAKYDTYTDATAISRSDGCTGNTLNLAFGGNEGADCCMALVQGMGATLAVDNVYYGGQGASGYIFNIFDGGALIVGPNLTMENATRDGAINIVSAAPGKTALININEQIYGFGNYTGNFLTCDDNTDISKSFFSANGSVAIVGDIGDSTVRIYSGALNLTGTVTKNKFLIGSGATVTSWSTNAQNPDTFSGNDITDLRNYSGLDNHGRQYDCFDSLILGIQSLKSSTVYYGDIQIAGGSIKLAAADATPDEGSWNRGDLILNAGTGVVAWRCLTKGTFGTLNSGNTTATCVAGNKYITITNSGNYESGLRIGQYISGASSTFTGARIVEIDTLNHKVWINSAVDNPGTDVAVSFYGPPTFAAVNSPALKQGNDYQISYSGSMTPDCNNGDFQIIVLGDGNAFTINAPSNPVPGAVLTLYIHNATGGGCGAISWGSGIYADALTGPANNKGKTITLRYMYPDWSGIWLQQGAASPDFARP